MRKRLFPSGEDFFFPALVSKHWELGCGLEAVCGVDSLFFCIFVRFVGMGLFAFVFDNMKRIAKEWDGVKNIPIYPYRVSE